MSPTTEWLEQIRARNRAALGLSGLGAARPQPVPWKALAIGVFALLAYNWLMP